MEKCDSNQPFADYDQEREDRDRRDIAREYGLDEDTSWAGIQAHKDGDDRQRYTKLLGLPMDASWIEISKEVVAQENMRRGIED